MKQTNKSETLFFIIFTAQQVAVWKFSAKFEVKG